MGKGKNRGVDHSKDERSAAGKQTTPEWNCVRVHRWREAPTGQEGGHRRADIGVVLKTGEFL